MMHELGIDWLVSAAYGSDCRERVSSELKSFYASAVGSCWARIGESLEHERQEPHLEVVHSPVARPATINLGRVEILVYDQYLGQVFNQLTSLALNDADVVRVDQYMYKLYAQRAYVAGRFRTAAIFGLAAKALLARSGKTSHDRPDVAYRAKLVVPQEVFAIAHELVHTCLADDRLEADERIAWYMELMISANKGVLRHVDYPNVVDKSAMEAVFSEDYSDAVRRAWMRRGVASEELPEPRLDRTETRELFDIREQMTDLVGSRPELLEECVCDAFAIIATLKALMSHGHDAVAVAGGAVLSLHHLRLVQFLDRAVAGHLGSSDMYTLADFFSQSVVRVSMLRVFLLTVLAMSEGAELASKIHRETVRLNDLHANVIFNQVMHCMNFAAIERRLERLPEVVASAQDYESDPRALKGLLGFPSTSDR